MSGKHKANPDTICLITTKIWLYEAILFVFIEDFMHFVVVSKIPSHLYKFVQLLEQLKEKKSIWIEKQQKLDYLG